MLGFAWSEIFLIGAVALVVIGPKDLPRVMRTMGLWSRKLRLLAGDFQRQFDDMVRQAELDEIKREAEKAMNVDDIKSDVEKAMNVDDIKSDLEKAVDVSGLERSMTMDEATAAAELPVLPPGETPPVPPPEGNVMADAVTETIHNPSLGAAAGGTPTAPAPASHPAPDSAREPTP